MQTEQFLATVFRYADTGYLRVVEVPNVSEDTEECWRNLKITYWAVTNNTVVAPSEFNPESEWYFNPALFRARDAEGSKENVAQAAVLW